MTTWAQFEEKFGSEKANELVKSFRDARRQEGRRGRVTARDRKTGETRLSRAFESFVKSTYGWQEEGSGQNPQQAESSQQQPQQQQVNTGVQQSSLGSSASNASGLFR